MRRAHVLPQEVWWVTDEMSTVLKKYYCGAHEVHGVLSPEPDPCPADRDTQTDRETDRCGNEGDDQTHRWTP